MEWLLGAAQRGELGADGLDERFSTELLDAIGGLGLIQGPGPTPEEHITPHPEWVDA